MKRFFFFASILLFFSCSVDSSETIIQTFIVASERQACQGNLDNQQCLLIKENEAQTTWSFFFDPIAGFTHEQGFEYVIRVNREFIPENADLADSSLYEYTLLEILSRVEKDSKGI